MQSSLTNHQFTIKRLQRAGIFHLFLLQHPISILWKLYFLLLSRQIHIKILVFRYFSSNYSLRCNHGLHTFFPAAFIKNLA